MEFRVERDTMGEVKVPYDKYWGAQQREVVIISKLVMKRCQLS